MSHPNPCQIARRTLRFTGRVAHCFKASPAPAPCISMPGTRWRTSRPLSIYQKWWLTPCCKAAADERRAFPERNPLTRIFCRLIDDEPFSEICLYASLGGPHFRIAARGWDKDAVWRSMCR